MHSCAIAAERSGRAFASFAVLAVVVHLTSCAPKRIDVSAEAAASAAIGLDQAIEFRTQEAPLDEVSAVGDALSPEDAIRRAAKSDPELQAALARTKIALADADQARMLPNPVLSVALRWGLGTPQVDVALAQGLVGLLRLPKQSSSADNRLREAAADAVTVALDVVADVQVRYIAVQTLESLLSVHAERRELLDRLVEVARARLEAQEGSRNDLTTLEAQRVELDVDIAEAQRQRREERLRLARLIGEPSSAATWQLQPWSAPTPLVATEDQWVNSALQHRPEVQSVAWRLAALGDDADLATFWWWSGVDIGAEAQRDDGWSAGPSLALPVPVFDTGQAARVHATAQQVEARHLLTNAKRKAVEEVRVSFQTFDACVNNLKRIQAELIPLQQQRRRHAEDAYRSGQTDVTGLYLAEQDLRAARAKAIEVESQLSIAFVRLQRAVGGSGVTTLAEKPSSATALDATSPSLSTSMPSTK